MLIFSNQAGFGSRTPINPKGDRDLIGLYDLAHKDVKLSVFLSAHFGDLIGALFIAVHFRPLPRWNIAGWKFDNDPRGRAAEVQHFVRQFRARTQHSLVGVGKIHDELSLQINAFTRKPVISNVTQIACSYQPAKRHFARRKCFPTATARV